MVKNKKPIYKRVWPYIVVVCLIAGASGAAAEKDDGSFGKNRDEISEKHPTRDMPVIDITEEKQEEKITVIEVEEPKGEVPSSAPVAEQEKEPVELPVVENVEEPKEEAPAEEPKEESRTVYITPSGKCYHYSLECAGKNGKPISLDDAIAKKYKPCDTCVN